MNKVTINEARQFINYNIKEGTYDEDMFEGWSDQKLVEFATKEEARADAYANAND